MGIYFSKSQQKLVYRSVLQVIAPSSCLCLLNTNILNTDIDSVNLNLFPKLSPSCYLASLGSHKNTEYSKLFNPF